MSTITSPLHLIGIGGAGMSGLARILLARGYRVSGSDAKDSRDLEALRMLGATTFVGHDARQITESQLGVIQLVVISAAIRDDNPELAAAREQGILVISRAELLAELMVGYRGIAIAGAHGKTTTTSMLTVALQNLGADPSFAIGGSLNESGANAHHGSGEFFVAEADESDGSFLRYRPEIAVVTNVEIDHLDHYPSVEAFETAFREFASTVQDAVVACVDDPGVQRLIASLRDQGAIRVPKFITYGFDAGADLRISNIEVMPGAMSADLYWHGDPVGRLRTIVPGVHNILNATAVVAVAMHLGFPFNEIARGIESYSGTRRRFELRGVGAGVRVIDDYAHHPTEVRATLNAARLVAGNGHVVVLFQPHRYSRTAAFIEEFADALKLADDVTVLEVYSAGEDPIPGISGRAIAFSIDPSGVRARFEPSFVDAAAQVATRCESGDLLLILGAGDVTMLAPSILDALEPSA